MLHTLPFIDGELEQWICSHINQCVVLSLELKWTAEMFNALTSNEPLFQLKMIMYVVHILLTIYSAFINFYYLFATVQDFKLLWILL